MNHVVVFQEQDTYAAWPANHGAWQWDNELLVGFLAGPHQQRGVHHVGFPLTPYLARSVDAGLTWTSEVHNFSSKKAQLKTPPKIDLSNPNLALRFCGDFDHGVDTNRLGGFFMSTDRGRVWDGPFVLNGPWYADKTLECTTRTRYLQDKNLFFFSNGFVEHWGADQSFCAKYDGEIESFEKLGQIGDDNARVVMPAVVAVGDRLVATVRRRLYSENWIEAYESLDNGVTWESLGRVCDTGYHNGNPPALTYFKGWYLCFAAHRANRQMMMYASKDGRAWESAPLREGAGGTNSYADIGYPQVFTFDNRVVCVYYWADRENPIQHIVATHIDV